MSLKYRLSRPVVYFNHEKSIHPHDSIKAMTLTRALFYVLLILCLSLIIKEFWGPRILGTDGNRASKLVGRRAP